MAESVFNKLKERYNTLLDAMDTPEAKAEKAQKIEEEKKKKETAKPRWWLMGLDK